MSAWKAKRFWESVSLHAVEGGYGILLDERRLKTPKKAPFVVPSKALAERIAAEWSAQTETINPNAMPLSRLANSAIDKVQHQGPEICANLAEYGDTDLLIYWVAEPLPLAQMQKAHWDDPLAWARRRLNHPIETTTALTGHKPSDGIFDNLYPVLAGLDAFELTAAHEFITILGSAFLGLALLEGAIDVTAAWEASRVESLYQQSLWGRDPEAEKQDSQKFKALNYAADFRVLLSTP